MDVFTLAAPVGTQPTFTWNASVTDVHPDFQARSGFITRAGDTEANAGLSLTRFSRPGALLERASLRVATRPSWSRRPRRAVPPDSG